MIELEEFIVPMLNSSGTKGTQQNPYSIEEYDTLMDAKTWPGGYVEGIGWCEPYDTENGEFVYYGYKENMDYGCSSYYNNNGANYGNSQDMNGGAALNNARLYDGVPYKTGGTSMSGMDCSGLITKAYNLSPRWTTSVPLTNYGFTIINVDKSNVNSFVQSLRAGDVICWTSRHAAIYVGGYRLYHAHGSDGKGCVGETNDLASYWFGHNTSSIVVYRK